MPRLVGGVVLVAAVVAFVLGRCRLNEASKESALERGLVALATAVRGDPGRFVEAERELAAASGGSIFDAYPLFLLELSRAIREGRAGEAAPEVRPVVLAIARGDLEGALAALPTIPEAFPGRQHLERLVVELLRRSN